MAKKLRFGIYCDVQNMPEVEESAQIWGLMGLIQNADRNGYDYFCVIEHHFFPTFSICTNPLALWSAAAQVTESIRFRTVCHTLPLHNPLILAGEIAMADILTRGRIDCGIGRGHGWLYDPASIPHRESMGRYEESMEILQLAWTEERFSFHGEYFDVTDVQVAPKPVQKPYPKVYMAGTSGAAFTKAAEHGWGIFLGAIAPFEIFRPGRDIYWEACKAFGTTPDFGYSRVVHIADDEKTARRECAAALENFFGLANEPMATIQSPETKQKLIDGGYGFYASDALLALGQMPADDIIDQGLAFVGTADQIRRDLEDFATESGIDEFCLITSFGGLDDALAARTQDRFAREILPAFR
ncbi:MAG: LLM class flavin-dependent oxidoreductase [Pseudomonadota bacterium]|nr:LLM class flavin-dependent oxidoreductase [Pseudomonadota bacterium]